MKQSKTDWDAVENKEVDLSDLPEVSFDCFANAIVRKGLKPVKKTQITLRVDADVLEWFKAQGKGYQTSINALLKAYVEANKNHAQKSGL